MNEIKGRFCQSCGMPMGDTNEFYGLETNGQKSEDYCKYCYENGSFKYDCTIDEMIEICTPHVVEGNEGMSKEQAYNMLKQFLPSLKRWK